MEAVIPKKTKKIFVECFKKNFKRFEFQLSKNVFQLKLLSKSKKQRSSIEKTIRYSLKKAVRAQ